MSLVLQSWRTTFSFMTAWIRMVYDRHIYQHAIQHFNILALFLFIFWRGSKTMFFLIQLGGHLPGQN